MAGRTTDREIAPRAPRKEAATGARVATPATAKMDSIRMAHLKLLAADLLSLTVHGTSHSASFARKGKLVSRVEAVGVVVSRERKEKYLSFLVDDGSGCVRCILWLNNQSDNFSGLSVAAEMALEEAAAVQLGKLVRVRGRITVYKGVVQVTVGDVVVERDPNAEVLHWLECIRLAKHCYDLPPRS